MLNRRQFTTGTCTAIGIYPLLAFLSSTGAVGAAQQESPSSHPLEWTEAVAPFRMVDRIHYVGSRDLAAYLIDGGSGLILLDSGLPEFAPKVLENVRSLGFDPKRIRVLLNSQAHLDHAGGLAAIKGATGAKMLASAEDAALLERGGKNDFQWGDRLAYPAVKVDGIVGDGQRVTVGGAVLTAHLTPGHTKGCTTWTMPIRVGARTLTAQFNCSVSVPGYRLLGTPAYTDMARDYARTFEKLRTLPCDIFLGSHASFFAMEAKRAKLRAGGENPFIDPAGCRRYLANSEAGFRQLLAREQLEARGKVPR